MNKQQKGVTLLEVLFALAIATSMLIGLSSYLWDQTRSQQDVLLAQFHNIVTQAAQNYIQDNYTTIQAGTFPATVTITQLISGGYLSSGMASTNSLGQAVCIKIVQPTSTTLSALVMGTGSVTTYGRAAHIAGLIGTLGGAVDSTGAVNGAGGSWTISSSNAASYGTCSSGSLAIGQFVAMLYFSNGALVSDFLHRSYVGNLSANTMNVPLGLSVQTSGATCSSTYVGFIARDSSGNVLACVNSSGTYTWTATSGSWKSPVTNYAALPLSGNSDGDVRMELGNYRAYVWSASGSAWKAIAVDNSGNMSVPGTLTAGALSTTGTVTASGTITSSSTVAGKTLLSTLSATESSSCSGYTAGSIATSADGSGTVLSCQSGTWQKNPATVPSGTICGYVTNNGGTGAFCQGYNPVSGCPSGYSRSQWNISPIGNGVLAFCYKN